MMHILSSLLVSRFYKVNAGFFLFAFIILFGILPGTETIRLHKGLMLAAVSAPSNTLIAIVLFSLYNLKCISFTSRELGLPENEFLYNLQSLPNAWQFGLLASAYISLYAPMLLYGCITAYVGFNSAHYFGAAAILLWQLLMVAIGTYGAFRKINTTWAKPLFAFPSVVLFRSKGFMSWLLHYSINNKKGVFISIKIFSLLALQLLVALNADKANKENVCFLITLCIAAHSLLPSYYVRFVETEMAFLRNMPVPLLHRLGQYAFTYSIILVPELLFLLYNEVHILPLQIIGSLYLLAISRLTLYTAMQYLPSMTLERYTGIIFVMFFITLILLASLSLWVFIAAEMCVALVLFSFYYYKYEPMAIKEE